MRFYLFAAVASTVFVSAAPQFFTVCDYSKFCGFMINLTFRQMPRGEEQRLASLLPFQVGRRQLR